MERLDKLLESWKRHTETHVALDSRIRLLTYKVDDVEAAVKAALEIVKEHKPEDSQKGTDDVTSS
jgi:hypothetical protein